MIDDLYQHRPGKQFKMSTPGNTSEPSGARGPPQGIKAQLTAAEYAELQKPLIFGNHQKQFKIFSAVVSAAIAYYMVFHHEFKPKRHVFSWVRDTRGTLLQLELIINNCGGVKKMQYYT